MPVFPFVVKCVRGKTPPGFGQIHLKDQGAISVPLVITECHTDLFCIAGFPLLDDPLPIRVDCLARHPFLLGLRGAAVIDTEQRQGPFHSY